VNQPAEIRGTRHVRLARPSVIAERRRGALYLRASQALASYPRAMTERLEHWAGRAPERVFLAQRAPDGAWRSGF